MPLSKDKKKVIVDSLKEIFKESESVVFFNFKGLKVNDTVAVRRALRNAGVGYVVAKKTLTKLALGDRKLEGTMPVMEGEIGLAYAKDLTAPARELYEFAKKFKESLKIVGGVFQGKYMNKEEMTAIASIPPRPVLLGQFLNVINAPVAGFVRALDAIAKSKPQN